MLTATDLFCGAGGSSSGLVAAGIDVKMAANHWKLAIETHSTNHPHTEHDCADLRETHPSLYPKTDILWASPECTNHSLAKGKKRKALHQLDLWGEHKIDPAEERSRATMREVVEFSEYHRYQFIIVENVVDIRYWAHYDAWIQEMHGLGYDHKALYLNAMFFGVPQSRDRIYIVFWRKGNRAPDLDFRPLAECPEHGLCNAIQVYKKHDYPWGRYGSRRQYVYRCPTCGMEVKPQHTPAYVAIDWSVPSERIGDRDKPLKEKTTKRILEGLKKFVTPIVVQTSYGSAHDPTSITDPMPSQTTRQSAALVQPFLASYYGSAQTTSTQEPVPTITTLDRHALVTPFMLAYANQLTPPRSVDDPMFTISTENFPGVVTPFVALMKNNSGSRSVDQSLATIVASAEHHALITPFIAHLRNHGAATGMDVSIGTITASAFHHALVQPFMVNYNNQESSLRSLEDAMPTIATQRTPRLIEPGDFDFSPEVMLPECGFRMLQPHELKRAMSFPDSYIILGNKREQVRQIGNAVCCNVAAWIAQRCVESLGKG